MSESKLTIITVAESKSRSGERRITEAELDTATISANMNHFLADLDTVLKSTPEQVGKFRLDEFEIFAEVSAEGTFKVLGTGITAGTTGGLRFVFRRSNKE